MTFFGREPVRWVGIIVAVVGAIVATLLGQGVISEAAAGKAVDTTEAIQQLLLILLPIITAEVGRRGATSVTEPKLPVGTPVLVDRPEGQPEDTPPPDAIVALRSQLR